MLSISVSRPPLPGGVEVSSVANKLLPADIADWLSELSAALGHAHLALFGLDLPPTLRADAGELFQRIDAAQAEVRALQLSRIARAREEKPPEWSRFVRPTD